MQVGKLANNTGLVNLESMADTGHGSVCLYEKNNEEGLHLLRMGVSAAIHDANNGGVWMLVIKSISSLLEGLFKLTTNKDGAVEVEYLIQEFNKARNELKGYSAQSTIILQLTEILFTVRLYEVSPFPRHLHS